MSWWQPVWALPASCLCPHPVAQAQEAMVPTPLPSQPCRRVGSSQPPAQLSPMPGGATAVQASASGVSPVHRETMDGVGGSGYRQERRHTPLSSGPSPTGWGHQQVVRVGCRERRVQVSPAWWRCCPRCAQRVCAESLGRTEHQSPSSHLGGMSCPQPHWAAPLPADLPGAPCPSSGELSSLPQGPCPSAPLPSLMLSLRLACGLPCGLPIPSLPLAFCHPLTHLHQF